MNAALKDYHSPFPSPKEAFDKLNGRKDFSKFDLSEAYLHIPVEENSSKLLCINTHRGMNKFDRLAFGIIVAPAIFQQVMNTMLGGYDFTLAYLDYIVISSKTKELHREHPNKVFAQIREFGFKVKGAKCDLSMNKIKYLRTDRDIVAKARKPSEQIGKSRLKLTCLSAAKSSERTGKTTEMVNTGWP